MRGHHADKIAHRHRPSAGQPPSRDGGLVGLLRPTGGTTPHAEIRQEAINRAIRAAVIIVAAKQQAAQPIWLPQRPVHVIVDNAAIAAVDAHPHFAQPQSNATTRVTRKSGAATF